MLINLFKLKILFKLMGNIIPEDRSIIPACDVSLEVFNRILQATGTMDGIGGL